METERIIGHKEKVLSIFYSYSTFKVIKEDELIELGFEKSLLDDNEILKIGNYKLIRFTQMGQIENIFYISKITDSSHNN